MKEEEERWINRRYGRSLGGEEWGVLKKRKLTEVRRKTNNRLNDEK